MNIGTICATLAIASNLAAAAEGPSPGLRYRLAPGREFSFHGESRSDKRDGRTYLVDWKVWSIRPEPDGAWRMVIRCDLRTGAGKGPARAGDEPADTIVWRCRMFDDGRLVDAATMGTVRDPYRLFPRLPSGDAERGRGWESTGPEREGVVRHHRLADAPGGEAAVISTKAEGPEDKVYALTHEYRATFDPRRGGVTRVETEDTSGYPAPGSTRGTIELVAVEDHGEGWADAFGAEAGRYFDAVEAHDAAALRASRDAGRCAEILAGARSALEKARAGLATPVFLDAIGQKLAEHDRSADGQATQARDRADRLGKPAPGWEAKDIDGVPRRLADYRGKVVVMDFWYRGCGWCMHAMPQVNRLSETFRDEPVAVLGMSIDEDEKDARVVIDAMRLGYPTIRAAGIPESYGVAAYPTLVVIDRRGMIREIHVGYSPRLHEDLSALIRGLLAEGPAG